MKIIFFGSDDFAVVNLKAMIASASKHQVLACVTQPDTRKGRHLEVSVSPVKEFALKSKIPVFQPAALLDEKFVSALKSFESDIFVVVAYGKILPKEILGLPKIFCINMHGSLLPKYRGAAPINWAIMNGEKTTGVTAIKLNPKMDAGDIIAQKEINIADDDTSISLRAKMADLSGELLLDVLDSIEQKEFTLTKQNEAQVTLAPKLTKELGVIEWQKGAQEIYRLVCALLPWPTAYTRYSGKLLKILEAEISVADCGKFKPGEVMNITPEGMDVATGQGALRLLRVHLESSKPMDAKSFVVGHKIGIGFKFE